VSDLPAFPHELDDVTGLPDDLEPTIDLNADRGALKKLAMEELFARCMSGLLPRSRPLKSWEPDTLDERHIQAILLRASGLQQKAIAAITGWDEPWVSVILNHPDAQYILTRLLSYAADNVIDLTARIKATAPEAFDTVVTVMRTSNDEKVRTANAFEILKMAGYGSRPAAPAANTTVQQGGVTVNVGQMNVATSVPTKGLGLLAAAISEAQGIGEVRYVQSVDELNGASAPQIGQGGDSGEVPASLLDSGQGDGSRPPATGLPVPIGRRREPGEELDEDDRAELVKLSQRDKERVA
jgi:hypothetical protein